VVHSFIPLGSSLCGRIENDPRKPDNRSSVDSEVDLLKDYKKRSPKDIKRRNFNSQLIMLANHIRKKLSQTSMLEDYHSIGNIIKTIHTPHKNSSK
jgi:hypothetical protein